MERGEQQKNRICLFQFKQEVSNANIKTIMSTELQKIIEKSDWNMSDHAYRRLNLCFFFWSLKQTKVEILWLNFNKKSTIIREIIGPLYPNLRILHLGENHVTSLEPLIRLNAPSLEKLYLDNNKIVRGKSLRKVYLPILSELNMNNNMIIDESWLTECSLSKSIRVMIGYPRNKDLMMCLWFMKGDVQEDTLIQSSRGSLSGEKQITRRMFTRINFDSKKMQMKNSINNQKKEWAVSA